MPVSRIDARAENEIALHLALQEIWAALGTNDLSGLESSIEHLRERCTSYALHETPSEVVPELRRNCERVKALLNRRSRDLHIFAQVAGAAGLHDMKEQSVGSMSCQR
jgi:hypothetical protein